MRVLVYGLSANKLAGIETFLLNMNKFMSDDMIFDYVLEDDRHVTIHQQAIDEKGGKTFYIPPKRRMLKNTVAWITLLRKKKKEYSTVYFNMYSLAWFIPVILARALGYKTIVHAHNNNLHNCGFLQRFMHAFNRQLQKCMKITRLTNSELSAKFFFDNKPATMIYCAIEPDKFKYDPASRDRIRKALGISEDRNVYGFSGRIEYQKNPLFLMDIFHAIQKTDNKAEFLVCGDGDLMEDTRKRAEEYKLKIHFAGSVRNIEEYYQAMDAFILPSRFEGLGIVLIEAQCSGLLCLTTKDVVPKQTAAIDKLVCFIPFESSADEWAELLEKRRSDYHKRCRYAEVIRKTRYNIYSEATVLEGALR